MITKPVKTALAAAGYDILPRTKFGYDPFLDIKKLSEAWRYPIDTIFDVGANTGQTVDMVRNYFATPLIVSFEPHPSVYLEFSEKVRGDKLVKAVNVALTSESGVKTMYEYDSTVLNSLVSNAQYAVRFNKNAGTIRVRCTTVDEYCVDNGINRIDLLKIDTEGHDFHVLEGARSFLKNKKIKFVYFEFNDIKERTNATGGSFEPIGDLLHSYGYRFIASYTDYIVTQGELFGVSNALYALPPSVDVE